MSASKRLEGRSESSAATASASCRFMSAAGTRNAGHASLQKAAAEGAEGGGSQSVSHSVNTAWQSCRAAEWRLQHIAGTPVTAVAAAVT